MSGDKPSLVQRFMGAFIEIEDHMKRMMGGLKSGAPGRFRALLDAYARQHRRNLSPSNERTLITLSELRNLLVHNMYVNGMPVADPSLCAVQEIEKVRDELLNPRTVLSVLNNPKPVVVHSDARVGETLQKMYQEDFSQVPVYDDKRYIGLLTTNTVARWVADQLERHGGMLEEVSVREVLSFAEKIENVLHHSCALSVAETVWHFTNSAASGRPVTALILTNSGKRDETPLGIVLPADLARLP